MTYLNLVNNVLKRLREAEVTTVTQNTYSAMIGEFVNDAKEFVEDAWDWSALRTTIVVSTTADDYSYSLTGSGIKDKLLDAVNDTSNLRMIQDSKARFNERQYISTSATGAPLYFTFTGVDGNDDRTIDVYPTPNGVYSLRFDMTVREAKLSEDVTDSVLPPSPIIHLATAMAVRERGETGGTSTQEYFAIANTSLSDAIALDAGHFPHETEWRAV
jgi:hypothetical protein